MRFKLAHWMVFMDAAGDAGTGGGGSADAGTATTATGTTATAGADATAGAATSVMATAAQTGDATGNQTDFIPDKYRVNKDDGTFDVEASARKLADGYGELSKRFGSGDAAPKTAAEYAVTVPETMKEVFGDLNADPIFTKFRDDMHGLGVNQKQFEGIMSKYFDLVPQLVAGGHQVTQETTTAELQKLWPDQASFKENINHSYRAAESVAKAAGLSFQDIEKSGLGNNPTFIRLMAAIGPEMSEDSSPSGNSPGGFASEDDIKSLMTSEANNNPKHKDHKATRAKVDAYYSRKYGETPIA